LCSPCLIQSTTLPTTTPVVANNTALITGILEKIFMSNVTPHDSTAFTASHLYKGSSISSKPRDVSTAPSIAHRDLLMMFTSAFLLVDTNLDNRTVNILESFSFCSFSESATFIK
jgi:hypothetical protein